MTRRLVVVGAGISGLTAAFEWHRRRPDDEIVVLEAGDRIGGKLHRVELAGHWYDTGPEAMLARVPEAVRLVEDLGLADQLVAPATTPASVVLLADRATVDREVRRIVEQGRTARGHIFNLGHGVLPDTDPGVLTHVVELVHELSAR